MKSATDLLSLIRPGAITIAASLAALASCTAAAEPQLDYSVKLAIKAHYENRLVLNNCTNLFRYYSMDASNWTSLGDAVRVQVVLFA